MHRERVAVYVDGYNFYYGIRDAKLLNSRWLSFVTLSEAMLKPHQNLEFVRYFTTRVRNDPGASERQSTYLDALNVNDRLHIEYGHFLTKTMKCRKCGAEWTKSEEKKTDVNIAVRLLDDAFDDRYDTAILISGDSDLSSPIESVHRRFPQKKIVVAFPPRRHSAELERVARHVVRISKSKVRGARMPAVVAGPDGLQLHAPTGWLPKQPS